MSRQPDSVAGLTFDGALADRPDDLTREPQVGDIYRPRAGQPGYWWIVGHVRGEFHETLLYLTFNLRGQIVGQGKAGIHYIRERQRVGFCALPTLDPEWFR